MTKIEWTHAPGFSGETWNPTVGCDPVSEGCRNCYAAREAVRLAGNPHPAIGPLYEGTSEMRGRGEHARPVFTGVVKLVYPRLEDPLSWQKPRMVFVDSMSDLFHPRVPTSYLDKVFGVMALAEAHLFLILTKRPGRALAYLTDQNPEKPERVQNRVSAAAWRTRIGRGEDVGYIPEDVAWPLPNVWIGTSIESQDVMDRASVLSHAPAAIRFLSLEPLLEELDLDRRLLSTGKIDWMIVGGESGPKARPFDVEWAEGILHLGTLYGVPVFVKQLGSRPLQGGEPLELADSKGGDPREWPEDLARARRWPAIAAAT